MGGSRGSAPTIIMPEQTVDERYQTVIPKESFQDLAETMNRIETDYNKAVDRRYDVMGTPAETGARQKLIDYQSAASYLASLPKFDVDTSFQTTPRPFDIGSTDASFTTPLGQVAGKQPTKSGISPGTSQLDLLKQVAKERLDFAKQDYMNALKLAQTKPRPTGTITKNPSFATRDKELYLPTQEGKTV